MRRVLASRRMLAVGAVAAVAIVVAAGYGYAAVTATNNTYTGCLQGGAISNVAIGAAPTKPCPNNAVQISWSQTGPQGATGATGPQGPKGDTGATGSQGPKGDTGATGSQGPKGDTGATGPQGVSGTDGKDGKDGTSLIGSPCSLPDNTPGTVQMSVAANGAISFLCHTSGGGTDLCADVPSYPNATTVCEPATGTLSITCSAGFADADNEITNGCEVNLQTDPNNCGAVGNTVALPNATGACVNGQPAILACNAHFADVDHVVANGCEVNLNINPNNCGAVGNAVPPSGSMHANWACSNGTIVLTSCVSGWVDVNGNPVDGCETQADPDPSGNTQATATSLGSLDCFDTNVKNIGGQTAIASTLDNDWYVVHADGGFLCQNDFGSSWAAPPTVAYDVITDKTTVLNRTANFTAGSPFYSDGTDIYIHVHPNGSFSDPQPYGLTFHL
jgi:hypothetical protein